MRASILLLTATLSVILTGCPPTLSEQRGEEHLAAWADAERHVHHGRLDEAEASYAEAAETAERRIDRDEADYRRSRVLIDQERYEDAAALLDELAARRPISRRTARALYDSALVRKEHLGQTEQANEIFEQVIREYPEDGLATRALFHRLDEWRQAGNHAAAIALCEELYEELHDTDFGDDLLKTIADIQLEAGNREEARETLERIVRDHPYPQGHRWDEAIWALAEMDVEDGHPHVAIARLERMLERHDSTTIIGSYTQSTMPLAVLTIARIYRDEIQDYDEADSQFRRLGRKFPRSILQDDADFERGLMWMEQGERERGCDIFRDVVEDYEVGHPRREAERLIASDCGDA